MNQTPSRSSGNTPDFLYRIAIDGLPIEMECLRAGSIYLINFDEWDDCTLLARQIFRRATVTTRGILVTTTDASGSIERLQDAISAHDLRTFRFIEGSVTALKTLMDDLDDSIRPYQRTIILMLPASVTGQMTQESRRALLAKCQPWITHNNCTVLILSAGGNVTRSSSEMLENNDLLAGLVHLKRLSGTQLEYRCAYWRSAHGVTGSRILTIVQHDDQLQVLAHQLPADQVSPVGKSERYIIERAAMSDLGQIKDDGWELVTSRERVYELARQEVDATVVFALSNFRQLPEIARLIHSLRLERGPLLKLVVRELSSQVRLRDEQNLLDCGANLIIGGHLSYTRFKSLLENIRTVRYTRELTQSVEALFADQAERDTQGVVPPAVFLKQVRDAIHKDQQRQKSNRRLTTSPAQSDEKPLEFLGVLVTMEPVPGLSARQALAQINLRRFEDLACHVDQDVFLFLQGCLPELVPAVLQQLFRLPFDEIFASHTVFEDSPGIQGGLQHLAETLKRHENRTQFGDHPELSPEPGDASHAQTQDDIALTDPDADRLGQAMRYTPRRTRLSLR